MAEHWLKQAQARRHSIAIGSQAAAMPAAQGEVLGNYPGNDGAIGLSDKAAGSEVLHLGELVSVIRDRLEVDATLSDDEIIGSLIEITNRADMRARWLQAFNSPLGNWLVLRGSDLNTSLSTVLMLLPPARD